MSFAGFNSGKFVKGRLQAALYFMRKKNRLRREGGGPSPEPEPEEIFFGAQTTGGDGNWGHGANRAMFRRLTLTAPGGEELTIKAVHVAIRTAGDGSIKGLVYSDLGTATPVGEQLGVSDPQLTTVAGYVRCPVVDVVVPSGTNVWSGAVWGPSGTGTGEFDSELVPAAPNTIMFNNTFNYDAPPADAPATAEPNYANTLACFIECTYIPN